MKINRGLAAVVAISLPAISTAAEGAVTRFRLAGDPANVSECRDLDPALARSHAITVNDGDVEITSAGGIEGRMREVRAGVYNMVFELSGQRLDVVADLSAAPKALAVFDRQFGCKWRANPEE